MSARTLRIILRANAAGGTPEPAEALSLAARAVAGASAVPYRARPLSSFGAPPREYYSMACSAEDVEVVATALRSSAGVEAVYEVPECRAPPSRPVVVGGELISIPHPVVSGIARSHLDAAPFGLGARSGWQLPGGAGDEVHFALLELGWKLDPNELAHLALAPEKRAPIAAADVAHGTQVLAIVLARDDPPSAGPFDETDGIGRMTGIAPNAKSVIAEVPSTEDVVAALHELSKRVSSVPEPVVLLTELEWVVPAGDRVFYASILGRSRTDDLVVRLAAETRVLPFDVDPAVLDLLSYLAFHHGTTCVVPMANGAIHEDGGTNILDELYDAIAARGHAWPMNIVRVAAAEHDAAENVWKRTGGSNYAPRYTTCFGPGAVQTIGPGGHFTVMTDTSAAAAVIAGLAVQLRSAARAAGLELGPDELRALLADASAGTAVGGFERPLPDVGAFCRRNNLTLPQVDIDRGTMRTPSRDIVIRRDGEPEGEPFDADAVLAPGETYRVEVRARAHGATGHHAFVRLWTVQQRACCFEEPQYVRVAVLRELPVGRDSEPAVFAWTPNVTGRVVLVAEVCVGNSELMSRNTAPRTWLRTGPGIAFRRLVLG